MDSPGQKYMVRTHDWKYIYCEEGSSEELYRVGTDPAELHDLAHDDAHGKLARELGDLLIKWCVDQGDEQMVRGGDLVASPAIDPASASFADQIMGWRWY
jgi:arylsulfatase A-like enzyme